MNKTFVLTITGPTASGKTQLAIELAKIFDGEIISADSMQIYKGMDIATAKPTAGERKIVPHHLIDFLEQEQSFSVADYTSLARKKINEIAGCGKLPVLVGGTGLYINSLIDNIEFDDTGTDIKFREEMKIIAQNQGNSFLLEKLREIDTVTAEKLHENNISRIIRALEVYHISGKKMSKVQSDSRKNPSPFIPLMIAIDFNPRELLYERINLRVDKMLEAGLLEEASTFFKNRSDYSTSSQAIGYKELKPYFDGEASLDICIEKLKQETRKYAKRQLTWFRKDERINWLVVNSSDLSKNSEEFNKILKNAENLVKSYRNKF